MGRQMDGRDLPALRSGCGVVVVVPDLLAARGTPRRAGGGTLRLRARGAQGQALVAGPRQGRGDLPPVPRVRRGPRRRDRGSAAVRRVALGLGRVGADAAKRGSAYGRAQERSAGAADLERRTGGPQAEARREGICSGPPLACHLNFSELRACELLRTPQPVEKVGIDQFDDPKEPENKAKTLQ